MFIHVNQNRVVIDVTEDVKYVGRNEKTGLKVIVLREDEAIGVIGSDLVIRPLVSSTLTPDFFAVAQVIPVTEIPEDYIPGKYTYNSDGSFEPYEGIVPKTIEELTEEIEEAVKSVFPEWDPDGYSYFAGERVTYKDTFYRCIQNHTSQADWTPEAAPSLWVRISDPSEEWPEWIQPLGSEDAYKKGDKVSHNDKHWISNVDANVWEPGVYGWDAAE